MNPVELLGAMKRTVEQLAAFNDIAKALTSTLEEGELLDLIGDRGSTLLGADRWSLLLEGDDGMLHFAVSRGPGAEKLRAEVVLSGEGIAGAAFAAGAPRLVADAARDKDFAPRFDAVTGLPTRSVLAVPLTVRGRVLGVIELVNSDGSPPFSEEDLRAAVAIADFAAIAIDNARNFKKVQELTLTDEHTGLANTRHLKRELAHELARCKRFGRPLALLFLDLDDFKSVNDTRGHLAGSQALRLAGQRLAGALRSIDLACRYGGDEFAALLVETGPDGARAAAERVVQAFREAPFEVAGRPLRLTVSAGWACFPDDAQTERGLLEAADRAMYRAKAEGRDRSHGP